MGPLPRLRERMPLNMPDHKREARRRRGKAPLVHMAADAERALTPMLEHRRGKARGLRGLDLLLALHNHTVEHADAALNKVAQFVVTHMAHAVETDADL